MNLRSFHILFIILSVALCLGFAYWEYTVYQAQGVAADLIIGGVSAAIGLGLAIYGVNFFRKSRNLVA